MKRARDGKGRFRRLPPDLARRISRLEAAGWTLVGETTWELPQGDPRWSIVSAPIKMTGPSLEEATRSAIGKQFELEALELRKRQLA